MPELMTPRLRLRPPEASDFDAWAALMADPESARYIGGVQPRAAAWRGFLVDAMAQQTVKAGGVGLADSVLAQMIKMQEQGA